MAAAELDLVNRDPNSINDHLQCKFEDVFAEPDGTHSIDCVWKLAYTCFNCWKGLCYRISTLLCGMCIAAEWGCEFAYISFFHIWFFTPCFKMLDINCGALKRLYGQCVNCCIEPCCMACGLVFHQFKK
ncbi:caveolin-3-like [Dreissena polymorpha]|uniref:caveolin-3-like n=1 Tax=Dreissena polymorpha TaxID=45954 RepID=UPI0022653DFA|nr:caveolin-3-like [Dreissena polymorpha]